MSRKITGDMHMKDVHGLKIYSNGMDQFKIIVTSDDGQVTIYLSRFFVTAIVDGLQAMVKDWCKIMDTLRQRLGV